MAIKNNLDVYEILDKAAKQRAKKDKIKVLQENSEVWAMRDILQGTYSDNIQWNLPAGKVPYTPADESSHPASLHKEHMKFKYFVKGLRESSRLPAVKREKLFIDMCESVHPRDAELLVAMINKEPTKGLTKTLVKEAFPDLIS
jgi:hypothetical protein